VSKEGSALVNQLTDVVFVLKDTKTEMWQRRTKSLEQIKVIFLNTVDFIENDAEIIDLVRSSCPQILQQHKGNSNGQRDSGRSLSPFNAFAGQGQGGASVSPGPPRPQHSSD